MNRLTFSCFILMFGLAFINSVNAVDVSITVSATTSNAAATAAATVAATAAEEEDEEGEEEEEKENPNEDNFKDDESDISVLESGDDANNGGHECRRICEEGKPKVCKYDFEIEYYSTMSNACFKCPYNKTDCRLKDCIPGNGAKRTVLVANKQMPGPTIEVCLGDAVEVKVANELPDISTTIHWHGILQKGEPFMDGVPFVSQCPIGPLASFLYRFHADSPGTHMWHAHSAFQRGDGLYGALVVKVPPDRNSHSKLYDFDLSEHIITVMDWENTYSADKFTLHIHAAADNKPSSLLVNGKGRYEQFQDGNELIYTPVERFTVEKGFRYRFRLVNTGFLNCPIEMSVDEHKITVIATDGEDLQPTEGDTLISLAGERYDFVIKANRDVKNYWMRFKGLLDCAEKKAFQVAILQYEGAEEDEYPEELVTYESAGGRGLKINEINKPIGEDNAIIVSELSSLPEPTRTDPTLKPEPDLKFYIAFDFYSLDNKHFRYTPNYGRYKFPDGKTVLTPQINHISMKFPSFPLMADLEKSKKLHFCNESTISIECRFKHCECTHVIRVPLDSVVEIVLIDEGLPYNANHPFHLHGHKFRVLGMDRLGNTTTEEEVRHLDKRGFIKRNLQNPPIKDTVTTPDGGYSILRFYANNPGYWIFHCHIDFHVELGMALLFKVGNESDFQTPPKNFPTCGDYAPNQNSANEYQTDLIPDQTLQNTTDDRHYYLIHTSSANRLTYGAPSLISLFLILKNAIRKQ